jgi:hypothetical protein
MTRNYMPITAQHSTTVTTTVTTLNVETEQITEKHPSGSSFGS